MCKKVLALIESILYENKIHKVLKKVAKQRISIILQPGNVPVIERAVGNDEATQALLLTAQIRGWVEVLHEALPTGKVDEQGNLSESSFQNIQTHWRLTDSGWAAIQRRHQMAIFSLIVGLTSIFIAISA
ncbi:hypothetical protein [Bowmanella dokdonensis]|uniref:Uncharacterized protein n=1 Tax=Bowmanella dokdonensis TaxID=751969 RepID=A0A939DQW2_9ALTE|nr:hypothetical protein [Bowmanella dokdonensis]MBN7827018.1 hypothetical protein [Bowmanella dokdonensis]